MFKIKDGRTKFFQWVVDRKLVVADDSINQVHFSNKTMAEATPCEVYTDEDGLRVADVPVQLLQQDWRISVYGYDKNYTRYEASFNVEARPKPADYVYERYISPEEAERRTEQYIKDNGLLTPEEAEAATEAVIASYGHAEERSY